MQETVYRVTEEQAVRWAMSFGDTEAAGAREMTQAQLHEVARQAAARQVADDPTADCVDSGIILQTIHDAGFAGAFEPEVENLAEETFRNLREAAAGMRA